MAVLVAEPVAPEANPITIPKLPVFSVASLPAANVNRNCVCLVTNGNAGADCLAISDGAAWYPVAIGTTACAAS